MGDRRILPRRIVGFGRGHPDLELLSIYSQGRLDDEWTEAVERHIAACDPCCRLLLILPEDPLVALLGRRPEEGAPARFQETRRGSRP